MLIVPLAVQLWAGCAPPRPIVPGMKPTRLRSIPILLSPSLSPPKGLPAFPVVPAVPCVPVLDFLPPIKLPIAAVPLPSPDPVLELATVAFEEAVLEFEGLATAFELLFETGFVTVLSLATLTLVFVPVIILSDFTG